MSLSIPFPFGWLLNKNVARGVEVNVSLAFLYWVWIALHPWPFVSDIAIFVLKGDVKLQLTVTHSLLTYFFKNSPVPFPRRRSYVATKPDFIFGVYFVLCFVMDACLLLLSTPAV